MTVMALLEEVQEDSVLWESVLQAVSVHNIGQLIVAADCGRDICSVTYYLPVLLVAGLITGLVIGVVAEIGCLRDYANITVFRVEWSRGGTMISYISEVNLRLLDMKIK